MNTLLYLAQVNEKTKKSLLIFIILFILVLLIFGFIYLVIDKHMKKNARQIDGYMVDLCRYKIVVNPQQFVKAVKYYEARNLFNSIKWALRLILFITAALLIYSLIAGKETLNKVFTDFFDLFPRFKWETIKSINEKLPAGSKVVGISWMPVSLIPNVTFVKIDWSDINLYLSTLFYVVSIVLFFKIAGAGLSYHARIRRGIEKSKTVFLKDLDTYNVYDDTATINQQQEPISSLAEAQQQQQQQGEQTDQTTENE